MSVVGGAAYRWVAAHRTLVSRRLGMERRIGSCVADAAGAARCDRR